MASELYRIRPYLHRDMVVLLENVSMSTGMSLGKVISGLLMESETFVELYNTFDPDSEDQLEELGNIFFMGLYFQKETCDNFKKRGE